MRHQLFDHHNALVVLLLCCTIAIATVFSKSARSRSPTDVANQVAVPLLDSAATTHNKIVPASFYIYSDPDIRMENLCKGAITANEDEDTMLVRQLTKHPQRTLNPETAEIFVIPTPILFSFQCDKRGHVERLDRAMNALMRSKWFQRHNGRDHLLGGFNYRFTAWFNDAQTNNSIFLPERWINLFENVTLTRNEYYGESKWEHHNQAERHPQSLYGQQWEISRRSIVIPYVEKAPFVATAATSYETWQQDRPIVIYYQTRKAPSAHGGTQLRHRPWQNTSQFYASCSIGRGSIVANKWMAKWPKSQFCLVIRGDTPSSHAFANAISSSCIPVVIAKHFEQVCLPFNIAPLDSFAVVYEESKWLDGGVQVLLETLLALEQHEIERLLAGLGKVQSQILWKHPQSQVASLILKQLARMTS